MSATVKFGEIETVVRRDLLNDNDSTASRWSSFQIIAAINRAVVTIGTKFNAWAAYDFSTGRRISNLDTRVISENCEADPNTLSTRIEFQVGTVTYTVAEFLAYIRNLVIPIDSRYHDAIAYIAAATVLDSSAGGDPVSAQLAANYLTIGKEHAIR